jgi:DNA-binding MarR family transcriptional regulator
MNFKAFIPAWLNQAGLSQADFRVYCCLAARADVKTGIAWPAAELIAKDCGMARNTVWKSLGRLEDGGFIRRNGKRFASSNRYQVLVPIGANETPKDELSIGANEIPKGDSPIGANETPSIGANEIRLSEQMDSRECITTKDNQGRVTKGNFSLPFDSQTFRETWQAWERHRKEIRKPITSESRKLQLKKLEAMGEQRAIAAINHSLEKGWQGIFEDTSSKPLEQKQTVNIGNRAGTYETL